MIEVIITHYEDLRVYNLSVYTSNRFFQCTYTYECYLKKKSF